MKRFWVSPAIAIVLFCSVLNPILISASTTDNRPVVPTISDVCFFGPIQGSGDWTCRPLTRVGSSSTFEGTFPLDANQFFLITSADGAKQSNFKEGKFGKSTVGNFLAIGGGNILVKTKGKYKITFDTQPKNNPQGPLFPFHMDLIPGSGFPSASIQPLQLHSAIQCGGSKTGLRFTLEFSWAVNMNKLTKNAFTLLSRNRGKLDLVAAAPNQVSIDSITVRSPTVAEFTLTISDSLSTLSEVGIQFHERAVPSTSADGNLNTAASYQLLCVDPSLSISYSPLVYLRDTSPLWVDVSRPKDGWWVTPIHGNVLPQTGEVIVTGWGRTEEFSCTSAGSRKHGITFKINPTEFYQLTRSPPVAGNQLSMNIRPVSEAPLTAGDVLYCSGHTPLADGRKLYLGGAYYKHLGLGKEQEYGLKYARIYDPASNSFVAVKQENPVGAGWYPTVRLLPDGRVLTTGGFESFSCDTKSADCLNPGISIFDPKLQQAGRNPWVLIANKHESDVLIEPGVKDYTRMYVLQTPIEKDGLIRHMVLLGHAGHPVFFNADTSLKIPAQKRFFRSNSPRPLNNGCSNDAGGIVVGTGEILEIAGCGSSRLDLYNPNTNAWTTVETGIIRSTPGSVLLPDGNVLLLNGENYHIEQISAIQSHRTESGDPRYPQIFNPYTRELRTIPSPSSVYRGYHNFAVLLKDGQVLTGGGVHSRGDIGCEQPTMQMLSPPYLTSKKARPVIQVKQEPIRVVAGSILEIHFSGVGQLLAGDGIHGAAGAVLMGVGAFTHGHDQHASYIPLTICSIQKSSGGAGASALSLAKLLVPAAPKIVPSDYLLFLVSKEGVASTGKYVHVELGNAVFDWNRPIQPSCSIASGSNGDRMVPKHFAAHTKKSAGIAHNDFASHGHQRKARHPNPKHQSPKP